MQNNHSKSHIDARTVIKITFIIILYQLKYVIFLWEIKIKFQKNLGTKNFFKSKLFWMIFYLFFYFDLLKKYNRLKKLLINCILIINKMINDIYLSKIKFLYSYPKKTQENINILKQDTGVSCLCQMCISLNKLFQSSINGSILPTINFWQQ